jgi:hypothetical protein
LVKTGFCEYENEFSGCIDDREYLDQLFDGRLIIVGLTGRGMFACDRVM